MMISFLDREDDSREEDEKVTAGQVMQVTKKLGNSSNLHETLHHLD